MKPKIILMSHGNMAVETLASAQMIMGEVDATALSMSAEEGSLGIAQKLSDLLAEYHEQPVLVIADLKGGTPCNVAMMQLSKYPKLRVLSGLNLAMVLEALISPLEDLDELCESLLAIGKEAVDKMELVSVDDDEYED